MCSVNYRFKISLNTYIIVVLHCLVFVDFIGVKEKQQRSLELNSITNCDYESLCYRFKRSLGLPGKKREPVTTALSVTYIHTTTSS